MTTLFDSELGVTVKNGDRSVSLEYIGESPEGDYNPNDPNSLPMVRIDVGILGEDGGCDDNFSSCSCINAKLITEERAEIVAKFLMAYVLENDDRLKSLVDEMSWIDENWNGEPFQGTTQPLFIKAELQKTALIEKVGDKPYKPTPSI